MNILLRMCALTVFAMYFWGSLIDHNDATSSGSAITEIATTQQGTQPVNSRTQVGVSMTQFFLYNRMSQAASTGIISWIIYFLGLVKPSFKCI